jgi:fatty-acid peroxygenase
LGQPAGRFFSAARAVYAELFYDPDRFMRQGAAPGRVQKTLFGRGGVQGLDGRAHRNRKQMFLSLMTPEGIGQLAETAAAWWRDYARKWESMDQVVLYDETHEILTRAVCAWAGVPLPEPEVRQRTRELTLRHQQRQGKRLKPRHAALHPESRSLRRARPP